ncbi:MAG: hypothetical protein KKB20_12290 [Proteobacteria bacterium]|nr:hypothetical protein [Pseudomonadota bacterium]
MKEFYIKESIDGKTFAAAPDPQLMGLKDRKCPLSGKDFTDKVRRVTPDNAEILGLKYDVAVAGIKKDGLYFGRFKLDLGATMVIE